MIVIIFIVVLLLTLLFTMFSSVDNNWCNLLFPNGTVSYHDALMHINKPLYSASQSLFPSPVLLDRKPNPNKSKIKIQVQLGLR